MGAVRVELRLVDGDLQRDEARVGPLDLLAPRPVLGLLERRDRRLGLRARLLDLLGPRAALELLEVGLRLARAAPAPAGAAPRGRPARASRSSCPAAHAIALVNEDVLHAAARARADGDGPRFDGPAPLVRARRLVRAEAEVRDDGRRERRRGAKRRALFRGATGSAMAVEAVVVTCQAPRPRYDAGRRRTVAGQRGNAAAFPPSTVTTQPVVARAVAR